ncbi:hypothetical protein J2S74_002972 [Evansella vedderi]|uniref:Uncharacterized protein n=1 Tax=Evansella vedderi TaxID=38282 RepID=A0ABT9ZXC7_9BACI|nr:hypothetical protein [Evansella vedderi]MDQ0255590.1 hypothetical protein [Evansella vedderi]
MKKKIILLSFVFLLLSQFTPMPVAFADFNENTELMGEEEMAVLEEAQDEADFTTGLWIGFLRSIMGINGISSINTLVFGNPYTIWGLGDGELVYGIFFEQEWNNAIRPVMMVFGGAFVAFITLSIMISTLKMGLRAYSPQSRADFWQDVQMWIIAAVFMATFPFIIEIIFGLNTAITHALRDAMIAQGNSPSSFSMIAAGGAGFQNSGLIVGSVLLWFAEWGLTVYLNIIYVMRKVVIMLLLMMLPLAGISLLYARTRSFFGTWLKELCGNIFLQSIHAMVIFGFAMLTNVGTASFMFKVGMIIMFIPVTGMISRWLNLGDSSTPLGQAATMMGAAGIGGAIMLSRRGLSMAKGGGKGANANSGASAGAGSSGGGDGGGGGGGFADDSGSTKIAEAAKGSTSNGWQRFKKVAGYSGAAAGASFGLAFGPMGMAMGGMAGNKIAQGAAQMPRNSIAGLKGVGQTLGSVKQHGGFKGMWNNLEARRQFGGNMGESLGLATGLPLNNAGRKMGQMMSGVSRNRVQNEVFGGKTLEDLQKTHPGQKVQWRQTNEGSAYYVDDGKGGKRISAMGAADNTLKQGETRKIDYEVPGGGTGFNKNEQGQYISSASQGKTAPIYGHKGDVLKKVPIGGNQGGGTQSIPKSQPQKTGSTDHLRRTSEAYIEGTDGRTYQDTRMDAKSVNPDDYFVHSIKGTDKRSTTDKGADALHNTSTKVKSLNKQVRDNVDSWSKSSPQIDYKRHKGII